MSDNQSSSLKSYVDSATGTVQSALGSLTGNTGDQVSTPVFNLPQGYRISYCTLPAYDPDCAKSAVRSASLSLFAIDLKSAYCDTTWLIVHVG